MFNFPSFPGCIGIILVCLPMIRAQIDTSGFPLCARPCISVGLGQTSCPQLDTKCLCQSPGYVDTSTTCVRSLCDEANRLKAYEFSKQICSAVGIDVAIPGLSSTSVSSAPSATAISKPTDTNPTSASTTSTNGASKTRSPPNSEASAGNQSGSISSDTSVPMSNGTGSSTPVGAIVGGVVGGAVAIAVVVMLGIWLLKREKRKRMELEMAANSSDPKPPMQPDQNSQGIWDGNNAFTWNPRTNVHDVQGGVSNSQ